jgi:hypothetical protein
LAQGSSTLASITGALGANGQMAKTLDMKGREAAVNLISVIVSQSKHFTDNFLQRK